MIIGGTAELHIIRYECFNRGSRHTSSFRPRRLLLPRNPQQSNKKNPPNPQNPRNPLEPSVIGACQGRCVCREHGYTNGMKTAISLPDAVFRAAERQAKRSQKSRSQLYADALAEYLSRHAPEEVTDAMNRVVDQLDEPRDPFVLAAARSVLERVEW